MTHLRNHIMLAVATAACAVAAPVKAEPSAQELFAQLAQKESPVAMQPEQRAAALPALGLLPGQADAVFAAAHAGASIVAIQQLLGDMCPLAKEQLQSIGSLALSAGGGSVGAFEKALPAMVYASQLTTLAEWGSRWSKHAKPELQECITKAFAQQKELTERNLLATLADYHPKPIYAALTAIPGQEENFQNLCRSVLQAMQQAAQGNDWQQGQYEGFTMGIHTSQLHLCKMLMGAEPTADALKQKLSERQVHLLMKAQEGSLLLILCEQPGDITLPSSQEASLLYTPLLAGADAHISQLRAAVWVHPLFFRALQTSLYADKSPLTLAMADAFRSIGQVDSTHQNVYLNATRDVLTLGAQPQEGLPRITRPLTMQVWQPSPGLLRAYTTMDAWGATFAPGELRLTAKATTPDTIYYAESTALDSPSIPRTEGRWQAFWGVGSAIFLTLQDESKEALTPCLRIAEQIAPIAQELENSLLTLSSSLGAPLAIVSGDGAKGEDPAVAVSAAVKSRAGLAEGWQQLLHTMGEAAAKFGLSPAIVTELPIESRDLGNSAASHTLRLPFLPQGMLPNITLDNSYFVLGYSPALNERLLAASISANRMPFSGAVCAVSFPGWAKTARTMTDRAGGQEGTALRITRFLERLAEKATLYLHSTTIQDGAVITGSSMYLK